jgi:hypothetical protein
MPKENDTGLGAADLAFEAELHAAAASIRLAAEDKENKAAVAALDRILAAIGTGIPPTLNKQDLWSDLAWCSTWYQTHVNHKRLKNWERRLSLIQTTAQRLTQLLPRNDPPDPAAAVLVPTAEPVPADPALAVAAPVPTALETEAADDIERNSGA